MTQVRFSIGRYLSTGTAAAYGTIRCAPDRRFTADKRIMLPLPFDVRFDEQGDALIELEPTRERFVWRIAILPNQCEKFERIVKVPDTNETIDFVDLLDVDPDTLKP